MIITILLWLNIFVVNTFSLWFKSVHQVLFIHQKLLSEVKKLSSIILHKTVNVLLCYCSKIQKIIGIQFSAFRFLFQILHSQLISATSMRASIVLKREQQIGLIFPFPFLVFIFTLRSQFSGVKIKVNTFLIHFSATHSPYSDKLQRYCLYIGTAGHYSLKPGLLMSFIIFLA